MPASADRPPAPGPGGTPPKAPVRHPVAPAPPRSRIGAHVLSALAGLVLTPFGLAVLAGGAHATASAVARGEAPSTAAVVAVVGGAVVLGIVAATAAGSGLGPLAGGALFGLGPGLAYVLNPASMARTTAAVLGPAEALTPDGVRLGIVALGRTGQLLFLGLTLVLVGLAAHLARRAGRASERTEARIAAAQQPAAVPTPPATRVVAHLVSIAIGLVATPVALALMAGGVGTLLAADGDAERSLTTVLVNPAGAGAALLVVVVLAAGWSSFGLVAGGLVWGVLPGVVGLLNPAGDGGVEAALSWIGDLVGPQAQDGLAVMTTNGTLLAWGAIATLGALGAHAARRDGALRERFETLARRAAA